MIQAAGLAVSIAGMSGPVQSHTDVSTDVAPVPSIRFPAAWYPAESDVAYTTAPVKGTSYTAVLVTTTTLITDPKTGEVVNSARKTRQMRDTEGRTRTETSMGTRSADDGSGREIEMTQVEVNDPVTHCGFRWVEPWVGKQVPTAGVTCQSRRLHYATQTTWAEDFKQVSTETQSVSGVIRRSEPLGEKTFSGFRALGIRLTGRLTGETSNVVGATEIWYSPRLKVVVSMRSNETLTYELTEIRQEEPRADLFYPPAGSRIEKGY